MKSFLLKEKTPIVKWSLIPDDHFFEGIIPEGYQLAVCPHQPYIVVDVDYNEEKGKDGFENIPKNIRVELEKTYNYNTKRKGRHYWLFYTGDKILMNKTSGLSIDLRIGADYSNNNAGGYVVYYPANNGDDIRKHTDQIKTTSIEMNKWLEELFA